jgi:hypothetical protein
MSRRESIFAWKETSLKPVARPAVQRVVATEAAMGYETVAGRLPPPD